MSNPMWTIAILDQRGEPKACSRCKYALLAGGHCFWAYLGEPHFDSGPAQALLDLINKAVTANQFILTSGAISARCQKWAPVESA